jgi:hypothetical protein
MDIASMSPQSNNAARRSREATPLQREESQREESQKEESQKEEQPSPVVANQAEYNPLDAESNDVIEAVAYASHPPNVEADTLPEAVDDDKGEAIQNAMATQDDIDATAATTVDEAQDMVMSEAADSSNHASEEESDSYEPPDAELSSPSKKSSRASTPFSPAPAGLDSMPSTNTDNLQDSTADAITAQQISTVQPDVADQHI